MERKGILTEQEENRIAELLDNAIKFKNPLLEIGDKFAFEQLIKLIDNVLIERKVPDTWQNPLEPIMDAIFEQEYEVATDLIVDQLNSIVDVDWIDDEIEQYIVEGLVKGLLALILKSIKK